MKKLYNDGYRGILFDIDNTLVPHGAPADERAIALFKKLKQIGFTTCLISNNKEPRVKSFCDKVDSDYIFKAGKPLPGGYEEGIRKMKTTKENTLFIGDQIFTDVLGANRAGLYTIMVKPIHPKEEIQIVLKRYIELEGNVFQIVDFQHVKPGKGAAFVRTKMKNIKNGGVVEKTFRPTEKFPPAHIERTDMQYLYTDGDLYYFMDVETFDQIALNEDMIGDSLKFVRENDMVKMISHNGDIFAVEPPMFAELEVTECEPGEKGNTATGATKPCTVETGAVVYVPLFVNLGDKLKIDTRTGEYLSRV